MSFEIQINEDETVLQRARGHVPAGHGREEGKAGVSMSDTDVIEVGAVYKGNGHCEIVIDLDDEVVDLFLEDDEVEDLEEGLSLPQFCALVKAIRKLDERTLARLGLT